MEDLGGENTGKSLSEALIFASTNPKYDKRMFIDLRFLHENYKIRTCCVHALFFCFVLTFKTIYEHNMFWACSFHGKSMNNLLIYCGLVDARIRGSDKYLLLI